MQQLSEMHFCRLEERRYKIVDSSVILFLMKVKLPIFLLLVIYYWLLIIPTISFAQEITPTPSLQQVSLLDTSASTNPLDEILQRLEIPKILGKIFLAAVPLEVGQAANVVPTGSDNHDWTFDTSRNYFLDSSKDTSAQNVLEIATTKKEGFDFIVRLWGELSGLLGFGNFGNHEAKEFFAQEVPLEVSEKALSGQIPSYNNLAKETTAEIPQVLGVQAQSLKGDEMIKSLPMLQCAALPLTVGNCAKSNTLMEIPPVTPPAVPTSIPTITP